MDAVRQNMEVDGLRTEMEEDASLCWLLKREQPNNDEEEYQVPCKDQVDLLE